MTEQSKIVAAGPAEVARSQPAPTSAPWSTDFAASEHPDTARHRIQREFVFAINGLTRDTIDRRHAYLCGLIDKAKEELAHARSSSNDLRRASVQQHVDELVAYVSGHGIVARPPNRNGDSTSANLSSYYVIDEIPTFLGEIRFMIDLWYEKELAKVHDELLKLTGLAVRLR